MDDLQDRLLEAIDDGEILTVVYAGGSQPGTAREIQPLRLTDDALRARCFRAGGLRTFHLDKLTVLESKQASPEKYKPEPTSEQASSQSINAVADRIGSDLALLPLHAMMSESAITLHYAKGDGRIVAGIGKSGKGGRTPWHVTGPDGRLQQFGKMEKASDMFLAVAQWASADPRPPPRMKAKKKTRMPVASKPERAEGPVHWRTMLFGMVLFVLWLIFSR